MSTDLAGRRILVVEDEMLIAVHVEEILVDLGCVVIGPVGQLDAALRLAAEQAPDAAILDVTIRGGAVYPVAELLSEQGVPMVFASGYSSWALPEKFRGLPRLQKPFRTRDIEETLRTMLQGGPTGQAGP